MAIELLRDPKSAAEAVRRGLLHRDDAERCVAERTHLTALTKNPSLPADLVERLAADPDEAVRLSVSLRPELDDTRRVSIDFTIEAFAKGGRGVGTRTGSPTPRCCDGPRPPPTRCFGAPLPQSPHLPPDLLHLLARTKDPLVEDLLGTHHPDTPEEVLMRVYARLGGTFSAWMAETHPRSPARVSPHATRATRTATTSGWPPGIRPPHPH
ncbi:hypothetical protein ABZ752_32750 [Streptomyces roseifaciens]